MGVLHCAKRGIQVIDVTTAGDDGHWDHADIKRLIEYRDTLAAELAIYKGREEAKQLVINQLEATLRKYGDHTIACVLETRGDPCNCGWTKALLSNFAQETEEKPHSSASPENV